MKAALDLYTETPGLWRILLAKVYGLAVRLRLWLISLGVIKQQSLSVRVISVGNLVVGGTGKTPTVLYIARMLTNRGIKTAILSRGYRGENPKDVNMVSDEQEVLMSPDQAGDEAYWLAANLPGIPVLTGRYRYALGRVAIERFGAQVLILDDGFNIWLCSETSTCCCWMPKNPGVTDSFYRPGLCGNPKAKPGEPTHFW